MEEAPKEGLTIMAEKHSSDSLDVYLNEQRADLEFFRLILQIWMSRMLDMLPQGPEALAAMEHEIDKILETPIEGSPEELMSANRFRQLLQTRADDFFQGMRATKGYPPRKRGTKMAN